jgi:diguanylate cyclase
MGKESSTPPRGASAEILRLALQRMSQHEASFHPSCYAVWYEYLAGNHPRLNQALDAWIAEGKVLDDAAIEYFYGKFLSECNLDKMQALRSDAQRILGDISRQAEEAGNQAHAYDDHLAQSSNLLNVQQDADDLRAVVSQLQGDTREMRSAVQDLQQNLQKSQQEIEALRSALESARTEVLTDPLTGVLNRRGFVGRLQAMLGMDPPLHLLMLDIDHFKKINDSYGHLFGDKVIRAVAAACSALAGADSAVARLGGEEFAMLLAGVSLDEARAVAEKIRIAVEAGKIRRGASQEPIGGITISIGVTTHRAGEEDAHFIDRADRALYASKQGGRNCTTVIVE